MDQAENPVQTRSIKKKVNIACLNLNFSLSITLSFHSRHNPAAFIAGNCRQDFYKLLQFNLTSNVLDRYVFDGRTRFVKLGRCDTLHPLNVTIRPLYSIMDTLANNQANSEL